MKARRLLLGLCAAVALAQFPGSPRPGGPLGGPNIPGSRRGQQQPPAQDQGKRGDSKNTATAGTTTEGMVRRVTSSQLVIEADDHRIVWYRIAGKTASLKDGKEAEIASFTPGDRVSVDSTEDDQGFFTAVEVRWESAGSAADRASARETADLPTQASAAPASSGGGAASRRDPGDERPVMRRKNSDVPEVVPQPAPAAAPPAVVPAPAAPAEEEKIDTRPATEVRQSAGGPSEGDDPGRPVLKRGAAPAARPAAPSPVPAAEARTAPVTVPPSPAPSPAVSQPILPQEDSLIQKAREVAAAYADSLPNFFAQQMTTRYHSDNPKRGWDPIDLVTADVAYQDGRETYKNIKVGNKAVNKSMDEIGGTRSTGEFSSQMEAIMRPGTGARFQRNGEDRIRNRQAVVFKFEIPRERSGWRIEQVSQLYYPAYRGSIWIDKETSRVLRIEQEARGMPMLFPLDTVETSTDYDFVRLAVGSDFLLPVEAEVLSCQRGTSSCQRNKIEFRNYRKFSSESEITFGDPPAQK